MVDVRCLSNLDKHFEELNTKKQLTANEILKIADIKDNEVLNFIQECIDYHILKFDLIVRCPICGTQKKILNDDLYVTEYCYKCSKVVHVEKLEVVYTYIDLKDRMTNFRALTNYISGKSEIFASDLYKSLNGKGELKDWLYKNVKRIVKRGKAEDYFHICNYSDILKDNIIDYLININLAIKIAERNKNNEVTKCLKDYIA